MPESATPATPAPTDAAANNALIQQIVAEARSSGQGLAFDPEAPLDADGGDDDGSTDAGPQTPGKPKPKPKDILNGKDQSTDQDPDQDPEEGDQDAEDQDAQAVPGDISVEAVTRALKGPDGVDMLALAEALGVDPEALRVTPGTHKALRVQQRKAKQMIERAHDLSKRLTEKYGDQVAARKAAATGELNPAIEFVENTFGMSWNELNRAVGQLLQGKPVADIESKRELRELKKQQAERDAESQKTAEAARVQEKVTAAKAWIATSIKADKLATPELNKQLSEAGFPTITDLVFEEMQAGYSRGLTDPRKALERVKLKLTKQARALQSAGLLGKPPVKTKPTLSSRPRDSAQAGAAGNGRPMTDAELRQAVLTEHGLWRK